MEYKKIAALMEQRGITAYRLSKDIGISQTAISHWKKGRSEPGLKALVKMSKYFEVPLKDFIE